MAELNTDLSKGKSTIVGSFHRVDSDVKKDFKAMTIFSVHKKDKIVEMLFSEYAKHGDEIFKILQTKKSK